MSVLFTISDIYNMLESSKIKDCLAVKTVGIPLKLAIENLSVGICLTGILYESKSDNSKYLPFRSYKFDESTDSKQWGKVHSAACSRSFLEFTGVLTIDPLMLEFYKIN